MSVVGIDLGSATTVIAVARNRGIDVITNEVSNRATPSLVGFGPKARTLGEPAKTNEISNFKNTVGSLKRIIGRNYDDPEVLEIENKFISAQLVDVNGQVGAKVQYLGQEEILSSVQLTAAFLTKIKDTAAAELKIPVSDVVISVPGWYTDAQRRAVLDASEIAGLNALRLMNDTTASALGYGITKTDLPEDNARYVAICDIGHSNYSVAIVSYLKGKLNVLSTAYDRHFGGRNIDQVLVDHFAKEFSTKYKLDLASNPKAMFRLSAAVEKMKKILSANAQAPISVESIMNDVDVSAMMKREELEALVQPLLTKTTEPLQRALSDAGISAADIEAIEMVGGCTRVPAIKEAISAFFGGKQLSFTLNQDEAVARGCAFGCAILSPVLRVRDFAVHDLTPYPIEFSWEKTDDIPDEDSQLEVFTKNNVVPSTKILTFYRKEAFTLTATYTDPSALPGKTNPWIGSYTIKNVTPNSTGDYAIVKVKARLNLHGILNVEQAYVVEEVEVEEVIPEAELPKDENKADGDDKQTEDSDMQDADAEPPKPKTRLIKKMVRKADLPIVTASGSIESSTKDQYKEREFNMAMTDRVVSETEDKKNALEEYIYEVRGKLDDEWAPYVDDAQREKLNSLLMDTEDWLYGDGEDAKKAKYVSKMEDLQRQAGPIRGRYFDAENKKAEEVRLAREAAEAKSGKKNQEARPSVPTT